MTRLVGNAREARGSIEIVYRLDLNDLDPAERPDAISALVDDLEPGSTIEIITADLGDGTGRVTQLLDELLAGGIRVKLCGPPQAVRTWLTGVTR